MLLIRHCEKRSPRFARDRLRNLNFPSAVIANRQQAVKQSRQNMNEKIYCVYILTNQRNTVLYTGISSDLPGRIFQHKNKLADGFTKRYNVDKLVYYETCDNAYGAISREKHIKAGLRKKKIELINKFNQEWKDLSDDI